jgi:hypothetical protein
VDTADRLARALLRGALALSACIVPDENLEGRPCPCASGYRCDTTRDVCVRGARDGGTADGPASDAPPAGDGGTACDCWTRVVTSPAPLDIKTAELDRAGNLYIAGRAAGDVDVAGIAFEARSETVVYVARLDASGEIDWAHGYSGDTFIDVGELAVDADGNSVLAGSMQGSATYGDIVLSAGARQDGLLVLHDASGDVTAAVNFPGEGGNAQARAAAFEGGRVSFSGQYSSDLDLGEGPLEPVTDASEHGFAAVFSLEGEQIWSRAMVPAAGGEVFVNGTALAADGAACFAIRFDQATDFGGGTVTPGGQDGMVAWYAAGGGLRGSALVGSLGADRAFRAAFTSDGDCVAIGAAGGSVTLESGALETHGGLDAWVARFDSDGRDVFAHAIGGSGEDFASSVDVGADGTIYVSGAFEGTIDVSGRALVSAGGTDGFVAAFDAGGALEWAARFGGSGDDALSDVSAGDGVIVVAGCFEREIALGETITAPAGRSACFVHRFAPAGDPRLVR